MASGLIYEGVVPPAPASPIATVSEGEVAQESVEAASIEEDSTEEATETEVEQALASVVASQFTGTWSERLSGAGLDQFEWSPGPGYYESRDNEALAIFESE